MHCPQIEPKTGRLQSTRAVYIQYLSTAAAALSDPPPKQCSTYWQGHLLSCRAGLSLQGCRICRTPYSWQHSGVVSGQGCCRIGMLDYPSTPPLSCNEHLLPGTASPCKDFWSFKHKGALKHHMLSESRTSSIYYKSTASPRVVGGLHLLVSSLVLGAADRHHHLNQEPCTSVTCRRGSKTHTDHTQLRQLSIPSQRHPPPFKQYTLKR